MTNKQLSPEAQAVLDAALETDFEIDFTNLDATLKASMKTVAADALRAAADQVVPLELPMDAIWWGTRADYLQEERQCTRSRLLAIADELEGSNV
jgi:hypothetical protein